MRIHTMKHNKHEKICNLMNNQINIISDEMETFTYQTGKFF